MHRTPFFDRIALALLGLIALMIALVLARGDRVGAQVSQTIPVNGGLASARGRIGILFKQPMQANSFQDRLEIQPGLSGQVVWEGNTLWFEPSKPLEAGVTYTVHLKPGGLSKDGRTVMQDLRFHFQVRQPEILYLSLKNTKPDLWRQPVSAETDALELTFTASGVYDYAPSPDGELIAYSAYNAQKGIDLWVIGRDGKLNRQVVACGMDRCTQPAWTPDGKQFVYTRKVSSNPLAKGGAPGGIYSVDPGSGQSTFLLPGSDPSWSPDGQWLVVADLQGGRIGIMNVNTGEQVQVEASVDQTPTWFPDGSKILYSNLQTGLGIPQERVYEIDFQSKKVSQILNGDVDQVEYTLPAVSPDGQWMVTSLHLMSGGETRQLWLMDVNGKKRKAITHDELINSSNYSWDLWGKAVLFQQFPYGKSDARPQVMLWDRGTDQLKLVAQAAALPEWLP